MLIAVSGQLQIGNCDYSAQLQLHDNYCDQNNNNYWKLITLLLNTCTH